MTGGPLKDREVYWPSALGSDATLREAAEAGSESVLHHVGMYVPHGMPCGYGDRFGRRPVEDRPDERA